MTISIIDAPHAFAIEHPSHYDPSIITSEDLVRDGQMRRLEDMDVLDDDGAPLAAFKGTMVRDLR